VVEALRMGSLDGQVAWVTGGGKGIGRAIALALGARGACVLVTGREERALGYVVGEIANGGGKARHVVADVRDPKAAARAVEKAIATWGRLDVVVANAAIRGGPVGGPLGGDEGHGEAVLATNLLGAYATFDAAARGMRAGRLIAMGCASHEGGAAFVASKAGLAALVGAAARDLSPRGIAAHHVVPPPGLEPEAIAEIVVSLCLETPSAPP